MKLPFIVLSLSFIIQISYCKQHASKDFIQNLKQYIEKENDSKMTQNQACKQSNDCLKGFFCKNSDCIAKKKEFESCLSGLDEECECGKCQSETYKWNKVCFKEDDCLRKGITRFNTCKRNKDCPNDYFCDIKHEVGYCTSKLGNKKIY